MTSTLSTNIAIAVAEFNHKVTGQLLQGALNQAQSLGLPTPQVVHVPGAVELPLAAQKLANSGKFAAVICLGAVIYGETDHYDYVCQQVSYGCQRVSLDTGIPVIFGVLTTQTAEQAFARSGGEKGNKGSEAMEAAIKMINASRAIKEFTYG